ncbi:MAG: AIM24 family protein [Methanoregula sp.]|uniref:AIM24 family protein n=1 Tax=Methanoregula sp. TaxID=2052170 RepID=UPI003BAFB38B
MDRPKLLSTSAVAENYAGYTYHLDGELVPALTVELKPGQSIFFEHHILLWKDTGIVISVRPMKGAMKRMIAGMQIFVTDATGPGQIAFSRDGPGHVFGFHMKPGQEIDVREHQFLAATSNLEYSYIRVKGFANMMFGGTGFFIDKFRCLTNDGILWMHGYGNVFEKVLGPGEQIDVEPGGWLYKDASVSMETNIQSISTGLLASMNIITNRFTGPGRIALQSMYIHYASGE